MISALEKMIHIVFVVSRSKVLGQRLVKGVKCYIVSVHYLINHMSSICHNIMGLFWRSLGQRLRSQRSMITNPFVLNILQTICEIFCPLPYKFFFLEHNSIKVAVTEFKLYSFLCHLS